MIIQFDQSADSVWCAGNLCVGPFKALRFAGVAYLGLRPRLVYAALSALKTDM
jgi:hypothetical protein